MDDRLRASDADRDRAAAQLHVHFAAGRLTPDELDDRLTAALAARTFGDLRRTLADLPGPAPAPQQDGSLERGYRRLLAFYPAAHRRVHGEQMLAGAAFAAVNPPLPTSYGLISTKPNVSTAGLHTEARSRTAARYWQLPRRQSGRPCRCAPCKAKSTSSVWSAAASCRSAHRRRPQPRQ
jgi:Domain of unknown function (DUF1707)